MIKINNPFQAFIAILNIAASGYYFWYNNYKLGALVACYAVASAILAIM